MTNQTDDGPLARVLELLQSQGARDVSLLESYGALIESSDDEGIQYLGRMVIDDEQRHHRVIVEMENRVESWMRADAVEPSTPGLAPRVDRELLAETSHLLGLEREDLAELHHLKHSLHDVPPTSLLPFLVTLMIHDAQKHIEILQFIRDYTG